MAQQEPFNISLTPFSGIPVILALFQFIPAAASHGCVNKFLLPRAFGEAATSSIPVKPPRCWMKLKSRFHVEFTAAVMQFHSTLSQKKYFRCKPDAGVKRDCLQNLL